jgi:hypothetical protein
MWLVADVLYSFSASPFLLIYFWLVLKLQLTYADVTISSPIIPRYESTMISNVLLVFLVLKILSTLITNNHPPSKSFTELNSQYDEFESSTKQFQMKTNL